MLPRASFVGFTKEFRCSDAFQKVGHVYDTQPGHHIRILLHGHYRIAYLIKQDGDVDILGVFHGAMELDRYL